MSTPATVQEAAAGTPGTAVTPPVTPTAKSMVAAAFNEPAPVAPVKMEMPAKAVKPAAEKAAVVAPAKPAETAVAKPTEEPAKEAVKPSDLPEDKLEIPSNASPEAVKNFKAYKESMKGILAAERERVSKAEKEVAEAHAIAERYKTATPADTADLAAKEARLKAAEDRLAILDLQSHPDFVRQYVQPKEKAVAQAAEVLAYNGKEGVDLKPLLSKSMKEFNAAVSEFTKDMNTADAATVTMALREARTLHANEAQALAKSNELRDAIQSKTAQAQKQAFELVASEVTTALKPLELTDSMSAEDKQGVLAYNQRIASLKAAAEKRAFGNVTEKEVARMAFDSEQLALMREHVVPGLERRFAAQNQVISDLTAQLEAVKGSRSPGNLGGDTTGGAGRPPTRAELLAKAYPGQKVG